MKLQELNRNIQNIQNNSVANSLFNMFVGELPNVNIDLNGPPPSRQQH